MIQQIFVGRLSRGMSLSKRGFKMGINGVSERLLAAGAVKDTVGALEDDAALHHFSHDAPH